MTATVRVTRVEGRVLIELRGEIDMDSARTVERRIDGEFDAPVFVDLGDVGFIDSSGLALLARLSTRARTDGHPLTILAPPTSIARRLLDIVDLGIPVRDELDSDAPLEGVAG